MALRSLQELLAEEEGAYEPSLASDPTPMPGQQGGLGFLETAKKSFISGTGSTQYSLGQILDAFGADETGQAWKKAGLKRAQENYIAYDKKPSLKSLVDPDFYATTMAQNLPTMGLLAAAALTGGAIAGGVAGAAGVAADSMAMAGIVNVARGVTSRLFESGMEAGQSYDEMIAKGRSEEDAVDAAVKTFWGNMPMALVDAAQYALFSKGMKLPLKDNVMKGILAKSPKVLKVAGHMAAQMGSEAAEEGYQDIVSRMAQGEPVALDDEMKLNMLAGAGMGGVFGAGGVGLSSVKAGMRAKATAKLEAAERNDELRRLMVEHNERVASVRGQTAGLLAAREAELSSYPLGYNEQEEEALHRDPGVVLPDDGSISPVGLSGQARRGAVSTVDERSSLEGEVFPDEDTSPRTFSVPRGKVREARAAGDADRAEEAKRQTRVVEGSDGTHYIVLSKEEVLRSRKAGELDRQNRMKGSEPAKLGSDGNYYIKVDAEKGTTTEKNKLGTITYPTTVTPPSSAKGEAVKAKSGAPVQIGTKKTNVSEVPAGRVFRVTETNIGATASDGRTVFARVVPDHASHTWGLEVSTAGRTTTIEVANKADGIAKLDGALQGALQRYEASLSKKPTEKAPAAPKVEKVNRPPVAPAPAPSKAPAGKKFDVFGNSVVGKKEASKPAPAPVKTEKPAPAPAKTKGELFKEKMAAAKKAKAEARAKAVAQPTPIKVLTGKSGKGQELLEKMKAAKAAKGDVFDEKKAEPQKESKKSVHGQFGLDRDRRPIETQLHLLMHKRGQSVEAGLTKILYYKEGALAALKGLAESSGLSTVNLTKDLELLRAQYGNGEKAAPVKVEKAAPAKVEKAAPAKRGKKAPEIIGTMDAKKGPRIIQEAKAPDGRGRPKSSAARVSEAVKKIGDLYTSMGVNGVAQSRFILNELTAEDENLRQATLAFLKDRIKGKLEEMPSWGQLFLDRLTEKNPAKKKITLPSFSSGGLSDDHVQDTFARGKVSDDNILWLTEAQLSPQHKVLRAFGKKLGLDVHFYKAFGKFESHGLYFGKTALLNLHVGWGQIGGAGFARFMFGHELGHHIASVSPRTFKAFVRAAGVSSEHIADWRAKVGKEAKGKSDAYVTEEIVCDMLGTEAQFGVLQSILEAKAPTLWDRIVQFANGFARALFGRHGASEWELVPVNQRTAYEQAVAKAFTTQHLYKQGRAARLGQAGAARSKKAVPSTPLTESEAKLNRAVVADKPPKTWKELLTGLKDSAITNLYDDLYPLFKAINKLIPGGIEKLEGKDPYSLILLSRSSAVGKAEALLFASEPGKKSFNEIVNKTAKGEYEKLTAYMLAMQCFDLTRHEMPLPQTVGGESLTMDDAKAVIKAAPPHIRQAFVELNRWQRQALRSLVGHRLSLQEYGALIKKWPNYIPMMRYFENDAEMEDHIAGLAAGKMTNLSSPIHERKGSKRPLKDPLRMMVMNAYRFTAFAARNESGLAIKGIADAPGGDAIFTKVGEAVPERGEGGRVGFKQMGVTTDDPKKSIFYIWDNGQKVYYQTTPEIYRAISTMHPQTVSAVLDLLGMPAKVLRAGATLTPEFAVRNPWRDTIQAAIYSDYGFIPIVDTIRGAYHALKKDNVYWDAVKAGAVKANVAAIDTNYLHRDMRRLLEKHNALISAANPKTVLGVLQSLSEWMEAGTRIGEFQKAFNKTGSVQIAGLAGRSISLDFLRGGSASKQANKVIAFFNAAMQGQLKMYEMFKKHPVRTTTKTLMYITLPSVVLFMMNKDDDRYWELPQWQRDMFWIIPTKDALIRIPKPFELGLLFGSTVERALAHFMHSEPDAFRGYAKGLWDAMSPGVIPSAMLPVIEWWANYSFFRGRPIVPEGETDLPAALQYGPYTHTFSKILGRYTGVSPRKVDNLVRGYGGGMGEYFMTLADWTVGVIDTDRVSKPAFEPAFDAPVLKGFTSKPYKSSESVEQFYSRLSELEGKWAASKREGHLWKGFNAAEMGQLKRMRKIQLLMSDVRKLRLEVLRSGLDPAIKRAKVDALDVYVMNLARIAVGKSFVKVVPQ